VLGRRALQPLLRLGPVALCALTAHAALYWSLFPADGVHGYFGWYEPAVAALSIASALVVGVAAVAALLGRRSRVLAALRATPPTAMSGVRLAALAAGWLVVQETIERSVGAGQFELATFGIAGWSIIVGATIVAAGALTLLARIGAAFVRAAASAPSRRFARSQSVVRWIASVPPRRRRPLADRRGLRAPPAAV
jgi:hypothetical protein